MTSTTPTRAEAFRALHAPGRILVLANAWDAGSARIIESCGAAAIATTSAGLAWSRGYADGNFLPSRVLAAAVAEIARVISLPLSVDFEGGYSNDPTKVGEAIAAVVDAGAVGINLEDGTEAPDLLCAKIDAVKRAARGRGVDLFVNARTDVLLKKLVAPERAESEILARATRYASAGADGLFVPALAEPAAIAKLASATALPLNVMIVPGLPAVAELAKLGVRRVSAGSRIAQSAFGVAREAATQLLRDGRYEALLGRAPTHPELNALFAEPRGEAR